LLPNLTGERVQDFATSGYVNSLASFADYQAAQNDFLASVESAAPRMRDVFITGRRVAPGIWVGRNDAIHPRAQLAPPVCIGDDCFIGDNVELGPNVVIGANVIVDEQATITASTVLENTYVGRLVNLQDRIAAQPFLIDAVTGQATRVVDHFLLAENTPTAIGNVLTRAGDGLIACGALLITLPLAIVLALGALAASGRIIARLPRVGKRANQNFDLLRFQTRRADGTFNAIGRALNRWELDRWLEWWNVLRGDLAIVGVKPIAPDTATALEEDWQHKRFECYPGLTGLWYTQLQRAATLEEILVTDAYYAATRCRRDDLRIILQTPRAWWTRARQGG
jgi:lipopolysaccharide/colanic/teichoic acid biosynthesis glycosyltransferase